MPPNHPLTHALTHPLTYPAGACVPCHSCLWHLHASIMCHHHVSSTCVINMCHHHVSAHLHCPPDTQRLCTTEALPPPRPPERPQEYARLAHVLPAFWLTVLKHILAESGGWVALPSSSRKGPPSPHPPQPPAAGPQGLVQPGACRTLQPGVAGGAGGAATVTPPDLDVELGLLRALSHHPPSFKEFWAAHARRRMLPAIQVGGWWQWQ